MSNLLTCKKYHNVNHAILGNEGNMICWQKLGRFKEQGLAQVVI